ncbi:hypothetical protein K1719_011174 [Acacia pycnantha]|nr:hypothetical protein K1719_011174 [Acacia pycnantha]
MGLNTAYAKEISLRLCKMLLAFYNTGHTFFQKHPVISGIFSVSFILYIFLSYIYSFLVYLSPFIIVTAIFIRIFWSSEQPQLRYVKRERRRSDLKHSRLAGKYCRNDFDLDGYYTHSSHYRRRSCRDKKLGLHSDNTEFSNAVSETNTENNGVNSPERSRVGSSDDNCVPCKKSPSSPNRETLRSEPSMSDLVHYGITEGIKEDENEVPKNDDDDDDDGIKDVVGSPKNNNGKEDSMELERKSRLENLIANSKARKELQMQLDKGVNPTHLLAPVLITRNNSFKGSKRFGADGTEIPDSATSTTRSPRSFNLLCNSPQARPATFHQESNQGNQKDKSSLFSGHESFNAGRFRRFPDKEKGSHDRLIDQLLSKCGTSDASGVTSPKPQSNFKEPDRSNVIAETDQNISSSKKPELSEKPEPRVHQMDPEKVLKFPISKSTTINESLFKSLAAPTGKNHENMFYPGRRIRKPPAHSIASDLQVEVSESGSPRKELTGSSSSSGDEESSVYDGDNERDYCSSGSEDIWGNSVQVREVQGIGDLESTPKADFHSNMDVLSPFPLQEIDEENSADVSSVSSTCELPGDTPTCAVGYDQNFFGDMRETAMQIETAQPLNSLDVPSSSQASSERLEEWCNPYKNYTKEEEDVTDMNDSATIDKDHIDNKTSNRDDGLSNLHQKSIADISVQSNLSISPQSVLPKKNPTDEVSSFASDQQRHTQVPQSTMEDMAKTTSSGELHSLNSQTSHYDEAKSDVEADTQDSSTHLAEKGTIDLTSSANIPTEEKIPLSEEKEVESQPLVNQESAAEPSMNARAMKFRSSNNFEGNHDNDSKENKAISSETEHSEEPRRVIQPQNFRRPPVPSVTTNSQILPMIS